MKKWLFSLCSVFFLCGWAQAAEPLQVEEQALLQRMHALNQMWVMSENHRFGATVNQDIPQAYAWLSLYVDRLPDDYPGSADMLSRLATQMTEDEVSAGQLIATELDDFYDFPPQLSEQELRQVFVLREGAHLNYVNYSPPIDSRLSFEALLIELRDNEQEELAKILEQRMQVLESRVRNPRTQTILFGQLAVLGPENPQSVMSRVKVYPGGYFLVLFNHSKDKVNFALSGYDTMTLQAPRSEATVLNIGTIELAPVAKAHQAALVGRITSSNDDSQIHVVLQVEPLENKERKEDIEFREPWWAPIVPSIRTPEGGFYVTDLSPTRYRLVIVKDGAVVRQQIVDLSRAEVRDVGQFVI